MLPVVILSPEAWNETAPTNKHQLARQFAGMTDVLYVHVSGRPAREMVWPPVRVSQLAPRLSAAELPGVPRRLQLATPAAATVQACLAAGAVKHWAARQGWGRYATLAYHPYPPRAIAVAANGPVVYHCVDHHVSFPEYARLRRHLESAEASLLKSADVVLASSDALGEHCRNWTDDVHVLHNVGDVELFARAAERWAGSTHGRVAFFHGTFSSHKIDYEFLHRVAGTSPEVRLRLIGSVVDDAGRPSFDELRRLPNVDWSDALPQSGVVDALREADVLLLPYAVTEHTRHVFPLKLTEYLATGKPIVSTPLPSIVGFCGDLVEYSSDGSDLGRIGAASPGRAAELRTARMDLVVGRTWAARAQTIASFIEDAA